MNGMGWVVVSELKRHKKKTNLLRSVGICLITFGIVGINGCGSVSELNKYGVKTSERVHHGKGKLPKKAGYYKVGKPYKVAGKWYYPREDTKYNKTGKASWYGDDFHGRKTANGEIFDMHALTAAHKTLPLPSLVKVTNLANKKSIIVRVNDRGPYHGGRIIDLSRAAATKLGYMGKGITNVRVEYFGKAASHPNGDKSKIAALGGGPRSKLNKRSFFDVVFGWNQPKFVAEKAKPKIAKSSTLLAYNKSPSLKLKTGDMQVYDPDVGAAISRTDTIAMESAPKASGNFIQVAMFKDIKQAVEYKKQLGNSVFSKIDIKHNGSVPIYLVMVQA